jgi:hypothetical protein
LNVSVSMPAACRTDFNHIAIVHDFMGFHITNKQKEPVRITLVASM